MKKPKRSPTSSARRAASAAPIKPAYPKLIGAWVAAFFLLLLIIRIPREVVTAVLDPSWGAVLDYAHAKKLQFGTDIVFAYGPLGYLAGQWFTGHAPGWRMLFDVALDFGIAAGVCLVAWRTLIYWRVLLLGFFVLLPATIRPGVFDVPMEIGLFCWTLLCLVETRPRVQYFAAILGALAVLGSMVKFTLLVIALISIVTVTANFILRGKPRLAVGLVLGYLAGALGLWVWLGQSPSHLGAYLSSSIAISTGYESAMGLQFKDSLWTAGVVTVILALAAGIIRLLAADEPVGARSWLRRGLVFAWLFCILFLAWKHGFLRAKSDLWAGFVALVAPALEALPVPASRRASIRAARACVLACCLLALWIEHSDDPAHFDNFAAREAARFDANLSALLYPPAYAREMGQLLDAERARDQLPLLRRIIGNRTVDVFGQNQAYAWFNELNYQPRPVFQSYAAYNGTLMDMNDRAFAANVAPEFVMFNSGPIDARYPALEDARVLRTLLADYTLVGAEPPFLLLKHQTNAVPQMTLLHEGSVHADEPINVAEYGDVDLWLEISLTPTLEGRLRQFLYKPSEVYLVVWDQSTTQRGMFRAPVPMLDAGFLASPVVLRNPDLVGLYTGTAIHRPGGYAIQLQPGTANFWHDPIQYRLYRIDTKLGRNSTPDPALMKLPVANQQNPRSSPVTENDFWRGRVV